MDKNFSELIKYLDKKFQETAKKKDLDATREDLAVLTNRVISIEEKVETLSTKEDFNNLLTAVDAYAKKADTYFQEMVMLAHKVDRHEKWLQQIAEKLDLKLEY